MVPPTPGGEDDTRSTSTDSSPTVLANAVCQTLKARTSLDRPLPAGCVGGKDGKGNGSNGDGDAGGSNQELDHSPDWDGPPLLLPPSSSTTAMRVVG
jgi:hypothetical protein